MTKVSLPRAWLSWLQRNASLQPARRLAQYIATCTPLDRTHGPLPDVRERLVTRHAAMIVKPTIHPQAHAGYASGGASPAADPLAFDAKAGTARASTLRCPPPVARLISQAPRQPISATPALTAPRSRASLHPQGSCSEPKPPCTASSSAGRPSPAQTLALTPSATGAPARSMSEAELTRLANSVYEKVRGHYQHQPKSSNKRRFPPVDPARAMADFARWRKARGLIQGLRAAEAPIQQFIERGVGNCGVMACHALLEAREAGLTATLWGLKDAAGRDADHVFCLVCRPGENAAPADVELGRPGTGVIIDPWAGVVARADHYGEQMKQKMQKWAGENKKILRHADLGGWVNATDPDWLKIFDAPRPYNMGS